MYMLPMIVDDITALPKNQRIIGLDVGDATIGVAISDPNHSVATPLTVIRRTKFMADLAELKKLITEWEAGALVIGLPLEMSGHEGKRCQSVRQFARNILKELEIIIYFYDERFSSKVMERQMLEADLSRQKREAKIDKLAACYILQGVLDKVN